MYRYFDPSDNSHLTNYESFDRIFDKLDGFMANLASSEEKELLLKMVSEVCYKQERPF
ncbi:hypothetical protein BH23THE1_BH23THE1_27820 [soil metagenome]